MYVLFLIGLVAVFFTYLTRNKQNGFGLKLAFAIIFIFLALRYDYGNDYKAYLDGFYEITSYENVLSEDMRWEPGWNLLHIIFKPFGFFAMVGFTSLLTAVVFYRFIRSFVPAKYQWLAVFLYVFDPYQILVPASGMRQNIPILLFIIAIEFLYRKKMVPFYLLLTIIGSTFHKSGIVVVPIIMLAFINIKINKFIAIVISILFTVFFFLGDYIFPYINAFISIYFEQYAFSYLYGEGAKFNSGIGFLFSLFQLIAILYYAGIEFNKPLELDDQWQDIDSNCYDELQLEQPDKFSLYNNIAARRLLFKLAIITFLFTPMGLQLMMIGRINMYFTPILIAVFPIILYTTKDKFFHLVFLSSLMLFTLFKFWAFFQSPVWKYKFGTYQTIFSAPQWY